MILQIIRSINKKLLSLKFYQIQYFSIFFTFEQVEDQSIKSIFGLKH